MSIVVVGAPKTLATACLMAAKPAVSVLETGATGVYDPRSPEKANLQIAHDEIEWQLVF